MSSDLYRLAILAEQNDTQNYNEEEQSYHDTLITNQPAWTKKFTACQTGTDYKEQCHVINTYAVRYLYMCHVFEIYVKCFDNPQAEIIHKPARIAEQYKKRNRIQFMRMRQSASSVRRVKATSHYIEYLFKCDADYYHVLYLRD